MRITPETVTDGQVAQVKAFVEASLRKSGLSKDNVQCLIGRGDELKSRLIPIFQELGQVEGNPFVGEKVVQKYYYPKGWKVPNVTELKERTARIFEGIDLSYVDELASKTVLPASADGIALIPKLSYLGKLWGLNDPYGKDYGRVVEKVVQLIGNFRAFHNYREGCLTERHIRLNKEAREILEQLEAETPGDALVLPINFGNLYAGYSVRNVRWKALHTNQLPLGSAQIGCLLLAMPERLVAYDDLFMDCPADEYSPHADGKFASSLCFFFDVDRLKFFSYWTDDAHEHYGSVVAFLSE